MVGQAKRYIQTKASTPDIRELVGSVIFTQSTAAGEAKYEDLAIRLCDPVFFLFFTTRIAQCGSVEAP